jgi:6-phosphofructokinase 2
MLGILTVTLNPAVDVTTAVSALKAEAKLRCETPRYEPGGGGINVSRVIQTLGGASTALVAVGGATGDQMRALLVEAGIDAIFLEARGMTRQSFAVHDLAAGEQFRFVLPGPEQDQAFTKKTLETLARMLAVGDYGYVVASGSLPPGLADDFYADIARIVRRNKARLILDTSGPALLSSLTSDVFLVKPDQVEAQALAREMGLDPDDLDGLAHALVKRRGVEVAIITLGPDGALLATKDQAVQFRPPKVKVVSKVGAGDSFIGALSFALASGWPVERACAYGVAAAAAAVTTGGTELARQKDVERLFSTVEEI